MRMSCLFLIFCWEIAQLNALADAKSKKKTSLDSAPNEWVKNQVKFQQKNVKKEDLNVAQKRVYMFQRSDVIEEDREYCIAGIVVSKPKNSEKRKHISLPIGQCSVCSKKFANGDIVVLFQRRIYDASTSNEAIDKSRSFKDPLHSLFEFHAACPAYGFNDDSHYFKIHGFFVFRPAKKPLQSIEYSGSAHCGTLNVKAKALRKKYAAGRLDGATLDSLLRDFENIITHPANFPCKTCAETSSIFVELASAVSVETLAEMLRTMRFSQFKAVGAILMKLPANQAASLFYRNVNLEIFDDFSALILWLHCDFGRLFAKYLDVHNFDELLPLKMKFLQKFLVEHRSYLKDEKQEYALKDFFDWRQKFTRKQTQLPAHARKENIELAIVLGWIFLYEEESKYLAHFLLGFNDHDLLEYFQDDRVFEYCVTTLLKHTKNTKRRLFILQAIFNGSEEKITTYAFCNLLAELPIDALNYDEILASKSTAKAKVLIESALKRINQNETKACIEKILSYFRDTQSENNLLILKENLDPLSIRSIERLGIKL